jgi:hypothetical protein
MQECYLGFIALKKYQLALKKYVLGPDAILKLCDLTLKKKVKDYM